MHLTRNYQENCVMARVMRQCKMHQKNFSLKQYGSWEAAERAGKTWVKAVLPLLPPKLMNSKGRMSSRNHSGVVGVFLARSVIRKKSGKEYEYWRWIARWPNCKFKGGLGWSINQLGDDDAFALAVLARNLETISRNKVRDGLTAIYGTAEHDRIMKLKRQDLEG